MGNKGASKSASEKRLCETRYFIKQRSKWCHKSRKRKKSPVAQGTRTHVLPLRGDIPVDVFLHLLLQINPTNLRQGLKLREKRAI